MSIIKKMRKQKAIWWERLSPPDEFGKFSFREPEEIDCRWQDIGREYRNAMGEMALSMGVVFPDRVLSVGDRLMRGPMDEDTPDDPLSIQTTFGIQRFDQVPNLKASETLYIAFI